MINCKKRKLVKPIMSCELIKIIYNYDKGNINFCKCTNNKNYVLGDTDVMYFINWIINCNNIDENSLSIFLSWYRDYTSKNNINKIYDLLSNVLSRKVNLSIPFIIYNVKYLSPEMFNYNSKILDNILNIQLTRQNAFDIFKLILSMYVNLNVNCVSYKNILESQFKRMYSNNIVQCPHNFIKISNITKKRINILKKYKSVIELLDIKIITDKKYKQFIPWTHLINVGIFTENIIMQHFEENFTPESTLYDITSGGCNIDCINSNVNVDSNAKCPKIYEILKPKTIIDSVNQTMVIDTKDKYQLLYSLEYDGGDTQAILSRYERYMTIRRAKSLLCIASLEHSSL